MASKRTPDSASESGGPGEGPSLSTVSRLAHRLQTWGKDWWPEPCVACGTLGDELATERGLCAGCATDLPRLESCCQRCAQPCAESVPLCGRCLKRLPAFDAAWIPYRYRYPLKPLLHAYKFNAQLSVGRALAHRWLALWPWARPDAVVAVPLHDSRLRERGFDQAYEVARCIAQHWQLPLLRLRRVRATQAQSGLKRNERRRNVRGAFSCQSPPKPGTVVLLMDDVMTTGATLNACARVLKTSGAGTVWVSALARAGKP